MSDSATIYNYPEFIAHYFEPHMRFDHSPALGQPAPSFPLTTLEGETIHLTDLWRQHRYTVVEFGSFT
jgi:hypothetical protein